MTKVIAEPLPACRVTCPEIAAEEFDTSARYPLEVWARLFTVTVCVPAVADEVAAVSSSTLVFELEPVFCARIPSKSVSELTSFDRFDISEPRLEITVSWLSSVLNWFFHGVSTFWRLATISETVELTSNPVPLVGEPKLKPTVPI
jgi:hypothetical protein